MDNKQIDELKQLASPLVEYLREKHHPYRAIVITDTSIRMTEDIVGIPFPPED